eukprot:GEMP01001940.1.p1 GENE.GEMP01001940.1~~GEMP01001940.1.p1  ORF type:complete len:1503 (+),score=407.10 GEMP01001940.1:185-4693(+)
MERRLYARRSGLDDVDAIHALYDRYFANDIIGAEAHGLFYRENISRVVSQIETAPLCVTVEDDEEQLEGFAVFSDAPSEGKGASTWEDWMSATSGETSANAGNSIFLRYFVGSQDSEQAAMDEIVRTTFSTLLTIQQIFVLIPSISTVEQLTKMMRPFRGQFFTEIEPVESDAPCPSFAENCTTIRCMRDDVIAPLFIRMARVEDHDDLVAVFNAQSEVVTEFYGEYFIAELIEAQNEENKAIVAEVDGRAVGLMCMTSDVDVNILSQCFDIECFDNLLKPKYMRKVFDQREREIHGFIVKEDFLLGDLLQAALTALDFTEFLQQVPANEDTFTGADLLQHLQVQEFPQISKHISITESFMKALWHVRWWRRVVGHKTALSHILVVKTARIIVEMNLKKKKEIARKILDVWEAVEKAFWMVKEEDDERQRILQEEREKAEREAMKKAKKGAKSQMEPPRSQKRRGSKDDAVVEIVETLEITSPVVRVLQLLNKLTGKQIEPEEKEESESEGDSESNVTPAIEDEKAEIEEEESEEDDAEDSQQSFKPVMNADLAGMWVILMHWWGRINIATPASVVDMDKCKAMLEDILAEDEDIIIAHHEAPSWLANVPPFAKDCFCINLFCLDQSYASQAHDFILPAFALYPEKNYCVVTQPHTSQRTPLVQGFTLADPKPSNTFSHVLYVIHRAAAEYVPPTVRVLQQNDRAIIAELVSGLPNEDALLTMAYLNDVGYVAEFDDQIVGFISVKHTDSERVEDLRKNFHLDDYLLVDYYEADGFSKLNACVIHPLMERYAREILKQVMRLERRSCFVLELDVNQPDELHPLIYKEFLQVAPRRPPALKKVKREKPVVTIFANLEQEEKYDSDEEIDRQKYASLALSVLPRKLLTEPKITVAARILVVGASDTGLSMLDSLLSIPHLHFASLTLLSPGKLCFETDDTAPLIAQSAAYSHCELRRVMLPLRVRIIPGRMIALDRQQRCVVLPDGSMLPYDYLVITAGLQDDALHQLKIRSWGIDVTEGYQKINGAMSCADPSLKNLLVEGGKLIKSLIWNPLSYAVVYGRSLDAYCVVQGLLARKVPPPKILMVLPPKQTGAAASTDAFHVKEVEDTIHAILQTMRIKVFDGYELLGVQRDNRDRLKALILREHPDAAGLLTQDTADKGKNDRGKMEPFSGGEDQRILSCRIVITADKQNADPDIFNAVHNNGLVYDGRLIVDHNFCTTDPAIYAAGSLCEFTRRYRTAGTDFHALRHDQYNGREVGAKVASGLLRTLDPVNNVVLAFGGSRPDGAMLSSQEPVNELPQFYMPIARGGLLPGYLHYYHIKTCLGGTIEDSDSRTNREISTNTLDTTNMCGQFTTLTINKFGRVDSITFLGYDDLDVDSLWGLVGLSEGFLNNLYDRWSAGSIPDIIEFLADDWAMALFHDRFLDFCHKLNLEIQGDLMPLIENSLDAKNWPNVITPVLLKEIQAKVPKESVKLIQERLLEYLRICRSHLKDYFLPEHWNLGK